MKLSLAIQKRIINTGIKMKSKIKEGVQVVHIIMASNLRNRVRCFLVLKITLGV